MNPKPQGLTPFLHPDPVSSSAEVVKFWKVVPHAAALARELRACTADELRRERTRTQAAKLRQLLAQSTGPSAVEWLARQLNSVSPGIHR